MLYFVQVLGKAGGGPRVTATPQHDHGSKLFDGLCFCFSLWRREGRRTHGEAESSKGRTGGAAPRARG